MPAPPSCRVFRRELPGGGFVAIDVVPSRSLLGRHRFDGCVVVERRAHANRGGIAPVVARATGKSTEEVIQQLLPSALSNAAIGAALLRCTAPCKGTGETPTVLERFPYGRGIGGIAS